MKFILQFLLHHGSAVIFFWNLLAHFGLPIPVVPLMLAVGALAALGYLPVANSFLVIFASAMIGDIILFLIARGRGKKFLGVFCRVTIDPDSCVRKTRLLLLRYGAPFLLFGNFVPWINSITAPLAGSSRMTLPVFVLFDGLGVLLWMVVYFFLGYYFGEKVEEHSQSMLAALRWIGILVLIFVVAFAVWKIVQRRRFLRQLALDRITPEELKEKLDSGAEVVIFDLRDPDEFIDEPRTLPGAVSIPFEQLRRDPRDIPRDREIVLTCT